LGGITNERQNSINVTGFGKTVPVCTRIEIHFIAYYNSQLKHYPDTVTQLLEIRRSAFTDDFLPTLSRHAGPTQNLCGHWGALIG